MMGVIGLVLDAFTLLIIARAIASWVAPRSRHPVVELMRQATDPVLKPIQKVLPPTGGIDFSPLVVLIGIQVLRRMLFI